MDYTITTSTVYNISSCRWNTTDTETTKLSYVACSIILIIMITWNWGELQMEILPPHPQNIHGQEATPLTAIQILQREPIKNRTYKICIQFNYTFS